MDKRIETSDNAGMSRKLIAGFFLGLVLASGPTELVAAQSYRDIAAEYLQAAVDAHNSGNNQATQELVSRSLSFARDFSDALYLDSLFAFQGQRFKIVEAQLREAIELGNFIYFSDEQAYVMLSELLFRVRKYEDLLESALSESRTHLRFENPDLGYFVLESINRLGQRSRYPAIIEDIETAFPDRLRILLAAEDPALPPSLRMEQLLASANPTDRTYLSVLRDFIFRLGPGESRIRWIQQYWRAGGDDDDRILSLYLEDVAADPPRLEAAVLEKLPGRAFSNYDGLQDIVSLLRSTRYGELADSVARGIDWPLHRDLNGDGIADQEVYYKDGEVRQWTIDRDQDGLSELLVNYREGMATDLSVFLGEQQWVASYGEYPYLSSIERAPVPDAARTQWLLPDLRVSLNTEGVLDAPPKPDAPRRLVPPNEEVILETLQRIVQDITELSYRLDTRRDGLVEAVQQRGLQTVYRRTDRDGNGIFEEYEVFLRDSGTFLSYLDSDEDGWFELCQVDGYSGMLVRQKSLGIGEYLSVDTGRIVAPPSQLQDTLLRTYQVIVSGRSNADP